MSTHLFFSIHFSILVYNNDNRFFNSRCSPDNLILVIKRGSSQQADYTDSSSSLSEADDTKNCATSNIQNPCLVPEPQSVSSTRHMMITIDGGQPNGQKIKIA